MDAQIQNLYNQLHKLQEFVWCMKKDLDNVIANCCGSTPPPVCNKPQIAIQPLSVSGETHSSFTLSVVATGDAPLTYQWYKAGVAISDATNASYFVSDSSPSDSGVYSVYISNTCGSVLSANASVSITTPVAHFTGYYGWVNDISQITSLGDIQDLQYSSNSFVHGSNWSADFTANPDAKILVAFEPNTEPAKTVWYGSALNNGSIGGSDDLFQIKSDISGWRGYYTSYPTTQTQTSIQFKIS